MGISKEIVNRYARLAHLQFDEAEQVQISRQLSSVLDHIEKISELDLDHLDATCQIQQLAGALRADVLCASLGAELALANAPDKESGHFLVPKVIKAKGH